MKKVVGIVIIDLAILIGLISLNQHGTLKLYPDALLIFGAISLFSTWLVTRRIVSLPIVSRDEISAAALGRVLVAPLIVVLSVAVVIAIVMGIIEKDSSYLVQAGIGLGVVGYLLFMVRFKRRGRNGKTPKF